MGKAASPLTLSPEEVQQLEVLASSNTTDERRVQIALALLLAGAGRSNVEIAEQCQITTGTVAQWRRRFAGSGMGWLRHVRGGVGRPVPIAASHGRSLGVLTGLYVSPAGRAVAVSSPDDDDRATTYRLCEHSGASTLRDFHRFVKSVDVRTPHGRAVHIVLDRAQFFIGYELGMWLSRPRHSRLQLCRTLDPSAWVAVAECARDELAIRSTTDGGAPRDVVGKAGQWVWEHARRGVE
jgi:hypothetical protein